MTASGCWDPARFVQHKALRRQAGQRRKAPAAPTDEITFWVFVDLGGPDAAPRYWIVPDWWIRNDIAEAHQAYLDRHGGRRARNPDSTHHAIDEKRLADWQGKWDILGIVA